MLTRHLVGAGVGLVAVPILVVSTFLLNDQINNLVARVDTTGGHGAPLLVVVTIVLGGVVGVLCGGRVISPVATLVSGALLFVLSVVLLVPLRFGLGQVGGFSYTQAGLGPTLLMLAVVLLVASAWPSRWRRTQQPM